MAEGMDSYITQGLTTGDNMSALESFFGPYRGSNESMRADEQLAHETYNLPKAYEGRNKFLESVLDFKIRKEDEFYTSNLLPWEFTDDLHVAWEIFSFNRTLADLEPHQGVPRYVSAQSESHTDNLLRRGLAFIIEHGFYKTERGKRHFALNLQQITDAVHTTCYFGVIHALLAGQNYYKEWRIKFGQQIARVGDLQQMERRRWAVVQKKKNGLYLLDAEIKHEMKREGIVPNVWVFPDKLGIYVNMVGDHQVDYHERGPQANENRERGDQKTTFRGLPVFESQSFDVDFTGAPIDLMVRERQCGEFFTLKAARDANGTRVAADNEDVYTSAQTKYIYDADTDSWAKIDYATYRPHAVNGDYFEEGGADAAARLTDHGVTSVVPNTPNPDLILFRPHQTYRMASAILAKGGRELGSTFHGHHDFMLSDDIIRKVHVGHYTFYSKSVVKRPKNYVIIEDIFAQGYVGGEGVRAFGMDAEMTPLGGDRYAKDEYMECRSQGNLGKGGYPSIVVVATNTVDGLHSCIDITGRFHPSVYERFHGDFQSAQREHYPASKTVFEALQLSDMDPYRATDADEFVNRVQRINTVCFRGCEGTTSDAGVFKVTQLNQGHWGENVYPGVRKVRDGENSFMRDCNYQIGL